VASYKNGLASLHRFIARKQRGIQTIPIVSWGLELMLAKALKSLSRKGRVIFTGIAWPSLEKKEAGV
jgi:hypothetical protein